MEIGDDTMEFVTLNNGVEMPMVGFGTDAANDALSYGEVMDAAVQAGYRFLIRQRCTATKTNLGTFWQVLV